MITRVAKEPIARPAEHKRHANTVVIRTPNLLRSPPMTGATRHIAPIMMDETHAATGKKRLSSVTKGG